MTPIDEMWPTSSDLAEVSQLLSVFTLQETCNVKADKRITLCIACVKHIDIHLL